jgi:uncharacterized repeat protein (TIGR01451 family)
MRVSDGTTVYTVEDGVTTSGAGVVADGSPVTGAVAATFQFPSITFLATAAISKPWGNSPQLAIVNLNVSASFQSAGTITIDVTDTDFNTPDNPTGPGTLTSVLRANDTGTVSAQQAGYANGGSPGGNVPFGGIDSATGNVFAAPLAATSNLFDSVTTSTPIANLIGHYSMSARTVFSGTAGSSVSLVNDLSFVPNGAPPAPELAITKVADSTSVTAGQTIGYTITIANTGTAAATGVILADPLPAGAGGDILWSIDTSNTGLGAGTSPAAFSISGAKGSQVLTLAGQPITLAAGATLTVHITSPTNSNDVSGGDVGVQSGVNPVDYLGAAGDYGVLYFLGSGVHTLSITNVTIGANIGVGTAVGGSGTPQVTFSGPGTITGRLDFQAATGQFNNNNASNVGPASVNYNVGGVTSAINTVTSLSSSLAGLGTSIALNGNQTINESAGQLDTINGVTYRVFNVTSYNENDGKLVTINGDGSGDPVVFNFGFNSNVNLGGDVALAGNGLNDDKVIWNFTTVGKAVSLNNNASSYPGLAFHGIILAPADKISLVNANLSGRVFGGNSSDMQLVSGLTIHAPVLNTATVTASNVTFDEDDSDSAGITITGPFKPPKALVSADSGVDATAEGVVGYGYSMERGTLLVYVDNSSGNVTPAEHARIDDAIAAYNTQLASDDLTLVEVGPDQASVANVTINVADTTVIGGVAAGVLGVTWANGSGMSITMVDGWNWWTGANSSEIGAGQYDFETAAMHELGHSIGLGHSPDSASVMYPYLASGQFKRALTVADLGLIHADGGVEPLLAAGFVSPSERHVAGTPRADQPTTLVLAPQLAVDGLGRLAGPLGTPDRTADAFWPTRDGRIDSSRLLGSVGIDFAAMASTFNLGRRLETSQLSVATIPVATDEPAREFRSRNLSATQVPADRGQVEDTSDLAEVDVSTSVVPIGPSFELAYGEMPAAAATSANHQVEVIAGVDSAEWTAGGIALASAGLVGFLATGSRSDLRTANSRRYKWLGVPV